MALDISNIGQAKDVLQGKKGNPLEELLQELCQDITDQLIESLDEHDVNASRRLRQSIKPTQPRYTAQGLEVSISMEHYWKYVNYGVNGFEVNRGAPSWGTQPNEGSFKDAISGWVRDKGITKPEQFATYDSFSYAIMANLRKKGMEARPFFTDVMNRDLAAAMRPRIEKILKRSIEVIVIDPWQ